MVQKAKNYKIIQKHKAHFHFADLLLARDENQLQMSYLLQFESNSRSAIVKKVVIEKTCGNRGKNMM